MTCPSTLNLWTKLESTGDVTNPQFERYGSGGAVNLITYTNGRFNNGAVCGDCGDPFVQWHQWMSFSSSNLNSDKGCIEFWYKPLPAPIGGGLSETVFFSIGQTHPYLTPHSGVMLWYDAGVDRLSAMVTIAGWGGIGCEIQPLGLVLYNLMHIAVSWDKDAGIDGTKSLVVYIDGVERASDTQLFPSYVSSSDLYFCGCPSNDMPGVIDNIKIWNYTKTDFSDKDTEDPCEEIVATQNSITIYWELIDPPLVVSADVRFQVQVDSANTFDTVNLVTYYWNSEEDNNIIAFQNGKIIKAFEIPIEYRQDRQELTYYYRVRSVGDYVTEDWSLTNTFTIPERKRDEYASDMFVANLADKNSYSKEGNNSNIYQVMHMYANEFDLANLEIDLTVSDNYLKECREASFYDIWGILADLEKGDFVWAEYREIVKVLTDTFLHGSTNYAIKRFVKILTGQDPYILEYRKNYTGWVLGQSHINYPRSFVVGDWNSKIDSFYAAITADDTVMLQGLGGWGSRKVVADTHIQISGIAGAPFTWTSSDSVGVWWIYTKYGTPWTIGRINYDPEIYDANVYCNLWSVYWNGLKLSNPVDLRSVRNRSIFIDPLLSRFNYDILPVIKLFSGYEIDHGCEIHIGDPFEFFTTRLSEYHNSVEVTINVESTAKFATAGLIYAKGEMISYTGITATSFTGCIRGVKNTLAQSHWKYETVVDLNYHDRFCKYINILKPANVLTHLIYHNGAI